MTTLMLIPASREREKREIGKSGMNTIFKITIQNTADI